MKLGKTSAFAAVICALLGAHAAKAQPVIEAVLNAASYSSTASPGCWVAIFGKKLAQTTVTAPSVPLDRSLGGVTTTFAGTAAPLLFVSPGQINALIPFEVTLSSSVAVIPVVVKTPEGTSNSYNIRLTRTAPGLFTRNNLGTGDAHIYSGEPWKPVPVIDTSMPAILLATGLGRTNPPGSSEAGGSSTPPFNEVADLSQVKVHIGETEADVQWAGLMPGFPGIYQLNVKANDAITNRLFIQQNGAQSNIADVGIPAGTNVANVQGTIDALIPEGASSYQSAPISLSVGLQAVRYSASFDILQGAAPFVVAAVSERGSAIIHFDPQAGTYNATLTVPTMLSRMGDFSEMLSMGDYSDSSIVYDLTDMSGGVVCLPLPNNKVPASRLDPIHMRAGSALPMPNAAGTPPIGYFKMTGPAPSGTRFVIDDTTNSLLSKFGGFLQIPCGNSLPARDDTLRLFVDGKLAASKSVSYALSKR